MFDPNGKLTLSNLI